MSNNELAIQINHKAFELIQEFNDNPEKRLRLYDLIFKCSFLGEELNEEDMAIKMAAKAILADIQECKKNYKEKCEKNAELEEARRRPEVFSAIYDFIVSDTRNLYSAVYGNKVAHKELYQDIKINFPIVSYDNDENNKLINGVIKTVRENYLNED